MSAAFYLVLCFLAVIWQGGFGSGFFAWGPDFMPLVVLSVVGLWYVSNQFFIVVTLLSSVIVDSMLGLRHLPNFKFIAALLIVMLILRSRTSKVPAHKDIIIMSVVVVGVLQGIKLFSDSLDIKYILLGFLYIAIVALFWWWVLNTKTFHWLDQYRQAKLKAVSK